MNVHCMESGRAAIDKKDVIEFFDELAPGWDHDLVVDTGKINTILDAAGVRENSRVLDVACGTGVLFPFYRQRRVADVLAVDISAEMARIAGEKALSPIRVVCGDIEALPGTGDFDCCVIYNAFPHFPDPARLVRHLSGWLKPGGRLTVAHSMSLEQLNRHHSGRAAKVSMGMLPAEELSAIFGHWFTVDIVVSDEEKYIVSGIRKD